MMQQQLLQYPMTDRGNEENLTWPPASPDVGDSNRTTSNTSSVFALGIEAMETEVGMRTLAQALCSGQAQVVVLHGQVERIKQRVLQSPTVVVNLTRDKPEPRHIESVMQPMQQAVTTIGEEALRDRAGAYFKKQLAPL